jgi:hypothetical protein
MMEITLNLPDELARRAQNEGLLSTEAMQRMLEDTLRRAAGQHLLEIADRIHAAGIAPMSEEEVAAEVQAYRVEKRAQGLQ